MKQEIQLLNKKAEFYSKKIKDSLDEMKKVIVGQEDTMIKILISIMADGHVLLEGVPGLAKTRMVQTLSEVTGGNFRRIQFTPDLLPADIIGTKIYNQKTCSFSTKKGPVFSNFILADEINRAPPKVQSALLEAMQERQVTISGDTYKLDRPFLVLATQNPIESEGTYRLPEAQVDRFMFKLLITYPERQEEKEIIERMTKGVNIKVTKVLGVKDIFEIQSFVPKVYADEKIVDYVSRIVDCTRHPDEYGLDINGDIEFGASPRASIWLILGAKANAILKGRGYVIPEDINEICHDVLRHRIILSYEAEAEDMITDQVIDMILEKVRVP